MLMERTTLGNVVAPIPRATHNRHATWIPTASSYLLRQLFIFRSPLLSHPPACESA